MKWTSTLPTEPGYYWVRNKRPGRNGGRKVEICELRYVNGFPEIWFIGWDIPARTGDGLEWWPSRVIMHFE